MADQTNSSQKLAADKASRPSSRAWYLLAIPVLMLLLAWSLNYVLVGLPVERKLSEDPRNNGCSLTAHYRYYLDANTLVLDLRILESVAPVDLFRALFQSAEVLHDSGRKFDRVILARSGTFVFLMDGEVFSTIGAEFGAGQNPIYLMRTLPEKLYRENGEPAFGRWEGGWLGVLGKQMEDVNNVAQQWSADN